MQRFLIGITPVGAFITRSAWDYLVDVKLREMYPFTVDCECYADDQSMYDELWTRYCVEHHYGRSGSKIVSDDFRQLILNLMENLHYLYDKFDELNEGVRLRIVDVPDDGRVYHVRSDGGSEYIAPVGKHIYNALPDWYARAKYIVTKFCSENVQPNDVCGEYENIQFVFNETYGLARFRDPNAREYYFVLKREEYYLDGETEKSSIRYVIVNDRDNPSNVTESLSKYDLDAICWLFAKMRSLYA